MQVALATQVSMDLEGSRLHFAVVSRIFSVCTLFVVFLSGLLLFFMFFTLVVREVVFAVKDKYRKKRRGSNMEM